VLAGREFLQWCKVVTFVDVVALLVTPHCCRQLLSCCCYQKYLQLAGIQGRRGKRAKMAGPPSPQAILGVAAWKTYPLMVSSTTTKITKTMKFLYHIYVEISRDTT